MKPITLPKEGSIALLCTGGSFDKVYGQGAGVRDMSFPSVSATAKIVHRLGIRDVRVFYKQEQAKDSLDMTEQDRKRIAAWCAKHRRAVVIHGTDTMIATARVIAAAHLKSTIVLTGSLQPACMRETDAELNLGGALIAAQMAPPGVYIVMDGRIHDWDNCRKDPITGHFVSI